MSFQAQNDLQTEVVKSRNVQSSNQVRVVQSISPRFTLAKGLFDNLCEQKLLRQELFHWQTCQMSNLGVGVVEKIDSEVKLSSLILFYT